MSCDLLVFRPIPGTGNRKLRIHGLARQPGMNDQFTEIPRLRLKIVDMWRVFACVICFFSLPVQAAQRANFSAWFVDSLVKVFPDTPATTSKPELILVSARNGHTGLQVALRSGSPQIVRMRVIAPHSSHAVLEVRTYRVGTVKVNSHPTDTPLDEVVRSEVGLYPDPLFPLEKEISLEASHTEALWVSIFTPKDTRPGSYRGVVEVEAGKQKLRLPFCVEVFGATVPKEQKLWVTNWLWFDHELMAKHYPQLKSDPDRYWRILENTGRTMAEYKQNVVLVPVRTLAKAQLVGGAIQYDFGLVDRWIEIFDRAGMARLIEGGHLSGRLGGGYDSPYVLPTDLVENGQIVRKELPANDPRAEQNLREFLRQLRSHLKEKGWLSRYVQHVHDEPHGAEMPIYKRFVHVVTEEMPGVPTLDAISLGEDISAQEETTIWVPKLGTFDERLDAIAAHEARGGQSWYYICLDPRGKYLNRFTDFPTLKVRLLPWVNYRYRLTGYLHWGGNFWTDRPFENVQPDWGGGFFLPAGDNAIVYPDAQHDGVFVSLRLEVMREGVEDYELLTESARHAPERTDALARKVIPTFTGYLRDVAQFRKFQRELLALASQDQKE
jgi:glycosyl hydrolase family 123